MDPANLSLLLAFGAGVLSFLSPCVLPMVPAYVGYMAGNTVQDGVETRRIYALLHSVAFGLGFTVVFVGFWASIGLIGSVLQDYSDLMRQAGGVILIVLGLHQTGIWRIAALYREIRIEPRLQGAPSMAASFAVGVAFAAGWTPCIGPVLAGIIGLATMSDTVWEGTFLLLAYSLGLSLPFLLTSLLLARATAVLKRFRRYMGAVSIASGLLLVAIGLMMLFDSFKLLPQYFNWGGL